jgi:hypothetical protein
LPRFYSVSFLPSAPHRMDAMAINKMSSGECSRVLSARESIMDENNLLDFP